MSKWMSKLTSDFGVVAASLNTKLPPVIPSRSPSLNWATGIGGFQPGKISVLYGPESCGKSLLAMMAVADAQKKDADAILLLVRHTEFGQFIPEEVSKKTTARIVIDTVNGWDREAWKNAGFQLFRLGDNKSEITK